MKPCKRDLGMSMNIHATSSKGFENTEVHTVVYTDYRITFEYLARHKFLKSPLELEVKHLFSYYTMRAFIYYSKQFYYSGLFTSSYSLYMIIDLRSKTTK